jgi:hypothetical protein
MYLSDHIEGKEHMIVGEMELNNGEASTNWTHTQAITLNTPNNTTYNSEKKVLKP